MCKCKSECSCVKSCSTKLSFYFDINDPQFFSKTNVVNPSATNLIEHVFINTPIYNNCGVQIGYKSSDDVLQQIGVNKYIVKINNTYFIEGKGTINWQYSFITDKPSVYYPIGIEAKSTIVSGTGCYIGSQGTVSLMPLVTGRRNVTIKFTP
jgi:hypothetical protein